MAGTDGSDPDGVAPRRDEPMRGVQLLLSSIGLFSISDALAKKLGESLPAVEIAWLRYATFLAVAALPLARRGGVRILRSRAPWLQVLRGMSVAGSAVAFITALQHLPLAEATAINFVSPVFVVVLSVLVNRERVGWRSWAAIGLGLAGMLIILRPGAEAFRVAALLPVLSSACWAAGVVVTRRMAGLDPPETTLFWTAATGFLALSLALPFGVVMPGAWQIGMGLAIGLVSSAAQWLVVLAYRAAPPSSLAPLSYTQLIFSGALGFLAFGTVPDGWTLLGAAIIAVAGLWTTRRESRRAG